MLHFQMCNISNFVQISSVLAPRSTAPTGLLAYYCQVVLQKSQLSDIRAKCRHHKWTL